MDQQKHKHALSLISNIDVVARLTADKDVTGEERSRGVQGVIFFKPNPALPRHGDHDYIILFATTSALTPGSRRASLQSCSPGVLGAIRGAARSTEPKHPSSPPRLYIAENDLQ